jgi:uncharacterized protein (DUF2267 family)
MRRHTPDAFDIAVQKSNVWLKDIELAGRLRSRFQAYTALRTVMHALRDCLPAPEVVKFSAQMPLLMKGVFFDGWKMSPKPLRLTEQGFYAHIRRGLGEQPGLEPKAALKAVLSGLYSHIDPPVVDALQLVLPREVRAAVQGALLELADEESEQMSGGGGGRRRVEEEGPAGE